MDNRAGQLFPNLWTHSSKWRRQNGTSDSLSHTHADYGPHQSDNNRCHYSYYNPRMAGIASAHRGNCCVERMDAILNKSDPANRFVILWFWATKFERVLQVAASKIGLEGKWLRNRITKWATSVSHLLSKTLYFWTYNHPRWRAFWSVQLHRAVSSLHPFDVPWLEPRH